MKKIRLLLISLLVFGLLVGCGNGISNNTENNPGTEQSPSGDVVDRDFASEVEFSMSTNTVKTEATVKSFIDGDTVHFYVPTDVVDTGVLKARFIAVNTPESTGKIEEYGKEAARFTREKLESAVSIYLESDSAEWNLDSTGERRLVWVWYQTEAGGAYRNLNIELLQNGLAIGSSTSNNRYGSIAGAALSHAMSAKLKVFSGQPDPDYYYGDAVELTLKELRTNINAYNGTKVAFNGVVTLNADNSVYVESYDADTDMYYGMTVYYGYGLSGPGLEILKVGNEVRIVGSVQYYEVGGTWQVSDVSYRQMKPNDPSNLQKISEGNSPAYVVTDANKFANGQVELLVGEEKQTFDYAELLLSTTVQMNNLKVKDIYTTKNEDSASKGAMTLTCQVDGVTISVRTAVLHDENGNLVTADAYMGKTINVKGIVDYYDGNYQIKVLSANHIEVK